MNLHQILNDIENMDDAQITEIAREVRSLLDGMADDERRKSRDDQQEAEALDSLIERQNTDETRKRLVELRKKRDPLADQRIIAKRMSDRAGAVENAVLRHNQRVDSLEEYAKMNPFMAIEIQTRMNTVIASEDSIAYTESEYIAGKNNFTETVARLRAEKNAKVAAAEEERARVFSEIEQLEQEFDTARKLSDPRVEKALKGIKTPGGKR